MDKLSVTLQDPAIRIRSADMNTHPLITTLVGAFVTAFFFGVIAKRLGVAPIVGFLLTGVVIGPFTPGFVADLSLAPELAEIGVVLLMFGVGLHFSVGDLLAVRKIAVPGAVLQILLATALGWALAYYGLNWSHVASLTFGLTLSTASTVVLDSLRAAGMKSITALSASKGSSRCSARRVMSGNS